MSDFLSNLALRSMGLAETMRPRLPALFEPPRLYSGLVASPSLFPIKRDEELFQQGVSGDVMEAPSGRPYAGRQSRDGDLASPELDRPETIKARPGNQTRRAAVASLTQSLDDVRSLSSRRSPREEDVSISAPRSSFSPESSVEESLPRFDKIQRDIVRFRIKRATGSGREVLDGLDDLVIGQHPLATETKPNLSGSQARSQRPPTSHTALPIASRSHSAPMATPTIEPSLGPGRSVAGFAAVPRSNPTGPVIRVTIGRVEVRAVFSDPPVRHAQPRQSRRTITLDEYLKCSSRGRR